MRLACEAASVCHQYGSRTVLQNISCSIPKGEFFVIVGPNGSGKTTLLRILAGLEHPGAGQVLWNDNQLSHWKAKDKAQYLAFVPQHIANDIPFTVAETVLLGCSSRQNFLGITTKKDQETAEEAIRLTGIAHLANRPVNILSGGERQRTFIARALAQQPEVILLDEPTSALDYAHQIQIMDMLASLRKTRGTTVIMVSHDLNLASMYATQALLLKNGTIVANGAPPSLFTESLLSQVYDCPMQVNTNTENGISQILPKAGREALRRNTVNEI